MTIASRAGLSRDRVARTLLLAWVGLVGCARARDLYGGPDASTDAAAMADRSDAPPADAGVDDVPVDVPRPDAPPIDLGVADVPSIDLGVADVPSMDRGAPDVPGPDVVPVDVPGPMDVRVDTGPVGPVACVPGTSSTVCGARPCVDGFCCDGPCDGACRSCGRPGSEGRCTNFPAATDPDSECAEQAAGTCGTTGTCDGAGACARHPSGTACDDRAACTAGDVCDGAGTCRGAAPASCAPGAGNECCVGGCDPMSGCRTTAGLCADQCSANHLRTMRACQGCGAAGAVGTCGGGGDFVCDATAHTLCQSFACGGTTFFCTNDGGTWQWRSAVRCDDGNACTHTDACAAGACTGTAVTCTSDVCTTRACNGTATCTATPHPGVACDDGNAMTNRDVCSAAGACVGTVVCTLPTDSCANGTQNRDRCTGARVVGRRVAASAAGYSISDSTCSANNRLDDCSWDAGADHAYRIWARAGETISASVTTGTACIGGSWSATLKLYQGADCGTVSCSRDVWCRDHIGTGAQTYVAPRDGWIVLIVDGSTAFDDDGAYTFRVRLTGCAEATCECP